MSWRPDFLLDDNLPRQDESQWRDGNVPEIDTNGNDPELLALSIL
jgi:hypothetical protein